MFLKYYKLLKYYKHCALRDIDVALPDSSVHHYMHLAGRRPKLGSRRLNPRR